MDIMKKHIMDCRAEFLIQVARALDIGSTDIAWPFLHDVFTGVRDIRHVVFCPEASMRGKEWPIEMWRRLECLLQMRGLHVTTVLSISRNDFPEVASQFRCPWVGSIEQLGVLISTASIVVAVDSFCGHFAAAIGRPVISLFGPTDPKLWRPWGAGNRVLQAPIASATPFTREAIMRYGPERMRLIAPEAVDVEVASAIASADFAN